MGVDVNKVYNKRDWSQDEIDGLKQATKRTHFDHFVNMWTDEAWARYQDARRRSWRKKGNVNPKETGQPRPMRGRFAERNASGGR